MYLLQTSPPFKLCFFPGPNIPDYAILSHRWVQPEVDFQLMQSWNATEPDTHHPSFAKISGCCRLAREDGWDYVWIDTCCIDKTSSHELSEAINSMYRYYRNAQVCYAYLYDVPAKSSSESLNAFCKSDWFTRGWTLQELLAPRTVVFYDHDWIEIGTKSSLQDDISRITGIKRPFHTIQNASVAEKMSWASSRKTQRVEDIAYCLLGLFDIYMTPIYGEKENAFRRLQLEIINKLNDESIFAWRQTGVADAEQRGLLAHSPDAFAGCGSIESGSLAYRRPPYSMTNGGLRMESLVFEDEDGAGDFVAMLDCQDQERDDDPPKILGVYMRKVSENSYFRIRCSSLKYCKVVEQARAKPQVVFVQQGDPADYAGMWFHDIFVDADSVLSQGFLVESEAGTAFDADGHFDLTLCSPKSGAECTIFTFHDPSRSETFAMVIDCVDGHLGANIIRVEGTYLVPLRVRDFLGDEHYRTTQPHRLDRMSRQLLSGRYVSVKLHPAKHNDLKKHVVKLSITQERYLRWPNTEPDLYIPADDKLEEVAKQARQQEYSEDQSMELPPPPYTVGDDAQPPADATWMEERKALDYATERRVSTSPETETMADIPAADTSHAELLEVPHPHRAIIPSSPGTENIQAGYDQASQPSLPPPPYLLTDVLDSVNLFYRSGFEFQTGFMELVPGSVDQKKRRRASDPGNINVTSSLEAISSSVAHRPVKRQLSFRG
jgi:Heterokaryon incompatibility protein (HET)